MEALADALRERGFDPKLLAVGDRFSLMLYGRR
jgi:hypothetical protein